MNSATPVYEWEESGVLPAQYAREIIDIITDTEVGIENVGDCSIVNPLGGEMYAMATQNLQQTQLLRSWLNNVLVDGHTWTRLSSSEYNDEEFHFVRIGYTNKNYKGFQRWIYYDQLQQIMLIHYRWSYLGLVSESVSESNLI